MGRQFLSSRKKSSIRLMCIKCKRMKTDRRIIPPTMQAFQTVIDQIINSSKQFFSRIGGEILKVRIPSHTTRSASGGIAICPILFVEFDNAGILGTGDFYDEIYKRYRRMRVDWWKAMETAGITIQSDPKATNRPHFVPVLSDEHTQGEPYPKLDRGFSRLKVVRLDDIPVSADQSRVIETYDLEYGIRTTKGKLFDFDEGLLLSVRSAAEAFPQIGCFTEFGAGSGSSSALVLRSAQVTEAIVNDSSKDLREHLETYLGELAREKSTRLTVRIGDALTMPYPTHIDVLAIGTAFGSQPVLWSKRGADLKSALGERGVVLVASAMVEMLFYFFLTHGGEERLNRWPWKKDLLSLSDLFENVTSMRVNDLVLTIASSSRSSVEKIVAHMEANGSEEFKPGLPYEMVGSGTRDIPKGV